MLINLIRRVFSLISQWLIAKDQSLSEQFEDSEQSRDCVRLIIGSRVFWLANKYRKLHNILRGFTEEDTCSNIFETVYYDLHLTESFPLLCLSAMLPVRWMPPESIREGLFTPCTDVWSYGVTLWELSTIGGFPYQGMSNAQVLEKVEQGCTLEIPHQSSLEM